MYTKSIAQAYFLLVTNEKGNFPTMRKEETKAGIVVASIMDLLLNEIITIEKNKVTVVQALSKELLHITPLYNYLTQKPRSLHKVMEDYITISERNMRELMTALGESLWEQHLVKKQDKGLFGNRKCYIPESNYKDEMIVSLRQMVLHDTNILSHDVALICILKETKNLNTYFDKHEYAQQKLKLKALKTSFEAKEYLKILHYIDDMIVMMAACVVNSSN